jgi:ABC-2 type transport system permease protein
MSIRRTWATARRVLDQLRRDRRTVALVLLLPPGLLALLRALLASNHPTFDRIALPLVGLFPLILMFLVTSIAMLRERSSGTLERLMALPIAKLDVLAGYGVAFALVASVQASFTWFVAVVALDAPTTGSPVLVVALAVANALLGVGLGLFLSGFATSEFQAVQFMPAVLLPQIFLSGVFVPRSEMPHALRLASDVLPLSYAYDALARTGAGTVDARLWGDLAIVGACTVTALALGVGSLRRQTD